MINFRELFDYEPTKWEKFKSKLVDIFLYLLLCYIVASCAIGTIYIVLQIKGLIV